MDSINKLLDTAKEKNDIISDRKLALALGIKNLVRYRKSYDTPSDKVAIRLAELCSMKPEVVIAICHQTKAKTSEEKRVWTHIYNMARTAAVFVGSVAVGVSGYAQNADASTFNALSTSSVSEAVVASLLIYIMSSNELDKLETGQETAFIA